MPAHANAGRGARKGLKARTKAGAKIRLRPLPFGREARASGDDEGDAQSSAHKHAETSSVVGPSLSRPASDRRLYKAQAET
jgi:hypothetical protein